MMIVQTDLVKVTVQTGANPVCGFVVSVCNSGNGLLEHRAVTEESQVMFLRVPVMLLE
jgi:hypothetical protein